MYTSPLRTLRIVICCIPLLCGGNALCRGSALETTVKWPADEMDTVQAVMAVADATSEVIVLEAWYDQTVAKEVEFRPLVSYQGDVVSGYADEMETNPARAIIPKTPTEVNAARGIEHVISSHGHLEKLSDKESHITGLVRKELLNNPEWPLNRKLRAEDLATPLTVESASSLLSSSYGMLSIKDPYLTLGITHDTVATLDREALRDKTVRDLVYQLVEKGFSPGFVFYVVSMPTEPDHATATEFKWSIRKLQERPE